MAPDRRDPPSRPGSRHIDDETLERFATGGLTPAERAQIQAHASECAACTALVAGLTMLRDEASRFDPAAPAAPSGPRRTWIPVSVAAAIAAAVLIPLVIRQSRPAAPASTVRQAGGDGLVAIAPAGVVSNGSIRFEWRPAASATSYEVSVFRQDGSEVWKRATAATSLEAPPEVRLQSGRYYWRVSALGADGPPVRSALTQFEVR